jgi:hypothetical protein
VLGGDLAFAAVEIAHLAGAHVSGADRETRLGAADERKVDQLIKGLGERRGRVDAGLLRLQPRMRTEGGERIGREESRNSAEHGRPIGRGVGEARPRKRRPDFLSLHAPPEFLERGQAVRQRVAGDQARIDGADRGADDPVRLDAVLVQRLIDAGLIGAERPAALKHQDDLTDGSLRRLDLRPLVVVRRTVRRAIGLLRISER